MDGRTKNPVVWLSDHIKPGDEITVRVVSTPGSQKRTKRVRRWPRRLTMRWYEKWRQETLLPTAQPKENILAAQDDRSNVVRRDCLQVVVRRPAEPSDQGGGINWPCFESWCTRHADRWNSRRLCQGSGSMGRWVRQGSVSSWNSAKVQRIWFGAQADSRSAPWLSVGQSP